MAELTFHLEKVVRAPQESFEDFDGPIELILQLLHKNKIEIKDIQISLLLAQYVDYLEQMRQMDLEIAAEFIAMASYLMLLKTRVLLAMGDEEAEQEMDALIKTLEEHRRREELSRARFAAAQFKGMQEKGSLQIFKPAESFHRDKSYRYRHLPAELTDALRDMMQRSERRLPPPPSAFTGIVGREVFPVADKIRDIVGRLLNAGKTAFRTLLHGAQSRSEVVAAFLAVLEMCRGKNVAVEENGSDYELTLLDGDVHGTS